MSLHLYKGRYDCFLALTVLLSGTLGHAQSAAPAQSTVPGVQTPSVPRQSQKATQAAPSAALVEAGTTLYQQNCAFCHGRDAGGGETGPDLTRSKLVSDDKGGDQIGAIVVNGRVEKGMPKFNLTPQEITSLAAFLHKQRDQSELHPGGRRGVDVADLQTGNAEEGKRYFNGAGACQSCHSPSGDLAHVASKHRGLKLEQRLLYPRDAPAKLTVTLPSGETVTGRLEYKDEFTVGLRDESGRYRSWAAAKVKYKVDDPASAHSDLLPKYSDDDIHNLMAYLQTLR